jgi:hypothetical protein
MITNPIAAGVTAGKRMPPSYSRAKNTKFNTTSKRAGAMKGKPARFGDMSKTRGKGAGKPAFAA